MPDALAFPNLVFPAAELLEALTHPRSPAESLKPMILTDKEPAAPHARTKIVATVGPACRAEEKLAELVAAGVDVFRLNMAHSSKAEHEAVVNSIRRVSEAQNRPIGILIDLAGPKIRLGELVQDPLTLAEGTRVSFVRGQVAKTATELTATYEPLIDELAPGNTVMLADGTVGLVVEEKGENFARCRVVQAGLVRSRQGINLPGVKLSVPAMSQEDFDAAVWGAKMGVDFVSLSFVRSPIEVQSLKDLLRAYGSLARVVAKIEKQEALDHLEAIVAAADGVMVARGDLGVEIDVARMPMAQKRIIATCHKHQKPVIIATQMLDSMQHSRRPTRAEVTDVANAILDGGDACMLSGETAIGEYPRDAVEMMNRVALATEEMFRDRAALPVPAISAQGLHPISHAVVYGAGRIASELHAKMTVVNTKSGATALALSKQRNFIPTIGVSDSPGTLRQMCLYWGVMPLPNAPANDGTSLVQHVTEWGKAEGRLNDGDRIVVVTVTAAGAGHNMVVVHQVE
ncbi:MAG TPA: pyruvate kinase [Pirellulales bacterium]|jgi:pyruvate kinase|nr:pyruvate kinase [Pirellulales bacterium]